MGMCLYTLLSPCSFVCMCVYQEACLPCVIFFPLRYSLNSLRNLPRISIWNVITVFNLFIVLVFIILINFYGNANRPNLWKWPLSSLQIQVSIITNMYLHKGKDKVFWTY